MADDTSVFLEGDNLNSLPAIMNKKLYELFLWLASNKLTLNVDKSLYDRAQLKLSNNNITVSNISLERYSFTKFLDDKKISITFHIWNDIKKTHQCLRVL